MTAPLLCSQTSVVNYIDQRPAAEKSAQLFFVVFEWKDPFIQKVQDVSIKMARQVGCLQARLLSWPRPGVWVACLMGLVFTARRQPQRWGLCLLFICLVSSTVPGTEELLRGDIN